MLRHMFRLGCLVVGIAGGWFIFENLKLLFDGWIPFAGAVGVALIVCAILYFPLLKPIADAGDDRLSVMLHRGRHIRTGSGIADLPDAPKAVNCNLCGGPDGPICPMCEQHLSNPPRR
jgi:hypothetical protein